MTCSGYLWTDSWSLAFRGRAGRASISEPFRRARASLSRPRIGSEAGRGTQRSRTMTHEMKSPSSQRNNQAVVLGGRRHRAPCRHVPERRDLRAVWRGAGTVISTCCRPRRPASASDQAAARAWLAIAGHGEHAHHVARGAKRPSHLGGSAAVRRDRMSARTRRYLSRRPRLPHALPDLARARDAASPGRLPIAEDLPDGIHQQVLHVHDATRHESLDESAVATGGRRALPHGRAPPALRGRPSRLPDLDHPRVGQLGLEDRDRRRRAQQARDDLRQRLGPAGGGQDAGVLADRCGAGGGGR